jgi:hypothetical protein
VRVPKKRQRRKKQAGTAIPPGAVVYAQATSEMTDGVRRVNLHGPGGPYTSFIAKKGDVEIVLPGTTIVGAPSNLEYVAWDGKRYLLMPTMESIQETDDLVFVARVDDPKDWSPLHAQVAAYKKIKELMEGPHEEIPEALVRRTLAQQFGIKPEEVTWKQIQFEVTGLLPYYPAITLVPSDATSQETWHSPPVLPDSLRADMRPPLHPIAREQIDQLLHRVDQQHWPNITKMRVKNFHPPDTPVPSPAPEILLGAIRCYATMLFGTEADQYDQFRPDGRYPAWLLRLAERTIAHVWSAVAKLEGWNQDEMLLGYHGLTKEKIEQDLKTVLWGIAAQYEQGIAPSQRKAAAGPAPPPAQPEPEAAKTSIPQESVADQLKRLKVECRLTAREMADALKVNLRSVFRNLNGAMPRATQIAAYEKLFSDRLGRTITLKNVTRTPS